MSDDACQTPGCGHPKVSHGTKGCAARRGGRQLAKERACTCTAFLAPRPVPEEASGCACGDPRPHGPHEFALQDATVPAPHADAEAAAKAAFEQWRAEQRHPVLYYDSVTFIAGYLRGRGDRG